ncbi:Lar family restriction alleviation protein [Acidovorax sp. NB1]|uniref:Lar family restriction alleviation protein n=1 Tax=Acidovorax sp. NB1 TaxID=1943571 RepID=UPI0010ECC2FE|nr:Lar family restriction alleviation protein [Acidovorax sp. NB1]GDY37277.1 hypothetical protein ACINB_31690 [Acidovorax sp. NB1]
MTTPTGAAELPEALLPCPFCGGEADVAEQAGIAWITCAQCLAEGPIAEHGDAAAKLWNSRAQPAGAATPAAPAPGVKVSKDRLPAWGVESHMDALADTLHVPEQGRRVDVHRSAPQPAVTAGAVDALDAVRYRWLRNESWAGYHSGNGTPKVYTIDGAGNRRVQLAEDAMDEAIDAALAAQRATHQGDHK